MQMHKVPATLLDADGFVASTGHVDLRLGFADCAMETLAIQIRDAEGKWVMIDASKEVLRAAIDEMQAERELRELFDEPVVEAEFAPAFEPSTMDGSVTLVSDGKFVAAAEPLILEIDPFNARGCNADVMISGQLASGETFVISFDSEDLRDAIGI